MVRNNTLYDFTLLKFAQTYFVTIIQSILENVSCAPEMGVYSASVGWNVLRSVWIRVWFKSSVSYKSSVFSLDDLFIAESRMFKSFTAIGLLYMSPPSDMLIFV